MKNAIRHVAPKSPAACSGIRAGEVLTHINGVPVQDVLDYKYYTYDPRLILTVETPSGRSRTVKVRKDAGEDLGLEFETYLMDRAHSCANNCIFCFVDQMPEGMRDTLYFKDDDARLSFLMGNYITLTNLSPREIQRIIDLKISPINISVHTTDPALRVEMLKNRRAGESIDVMRRFAEGGITMNCQIVACPGINDGPALARTMEDLASMYPGVDSVSIVPVGLTKYREGLCALRPYNRESAREVVAQVEAFGMHCLERFGTRIFWCSDEFYLLSELPLPENEFYEEYQQLENGVGMLRIMETEFLEAIEDETDARVPPAFSIATGMSAAPLMEKLARLAEERFGVKCTVHPIRNDFFGELIVVAGLITGGDLIAQLRGKDLGSRLLLPDCMLKYHENVFLDDVTVEQVREELGVPIGFVSQSGKALLRGMLHPEETVSAVSAPCESGEEFYRYNPPGERK